MGIIDMEGLPVKLVTTYALKYEWRWGMKSWMQQARETTGLTTIECAKALLLSEKDYLIRENNPGMLTIDELVALSFELNDESRRIIIEGVRSAIL